MSKSKTSFKAFLESVAITADNLADFAGIKQNNLSDRVEFKKIEKLDPTFAKKLLLAWEGDAHDFKTKKTFEPLFSQMVTAKNIEKLSKIKLTPELEKDFNLLLALHAQTFKQKSDKPAGNANSDVWSHVEWSRDQTKKAAFESLRIEVEQLLQE
jgi:hypothetical protein